jgi:hypothetical protein
MKTASVHSKFLENVQSFDWNKVVKQIDEAGGLGWTDWVPTVQELKDKVGYLFDQSWADKYGWSEQYGLRVNRQTGEIEFDVSMSERKNQHA